MHLAEVDLIDAGGLGTLIFCKTMAHVAGIELILMNPTERTRELLKLTNLDSVFEICEDPEPLSRLTTPQLQPESAAHLVYPSDAAQNTC